MYKKFILLIPIFIMFLACEDNSSPIISDEEFVVVWGFVFAGEQVDDIQLTGTLPLDADSTDIPPPINDADVSIFKDNIEYELVLSPGDSGYYHYNGDDLVLEASDLIQLHIVWNEQDIFAESIIPTPPSNVNISDTTYAIPDFDDFESLRDWRESSEEMVITWEVADPNDWYYVSMINIEDDPVPVESIFDNVVREFVFPPIQDSSYRIRLPLIEHLGKHEIKVYKVNQEYVDLYESREQDSRDLNEPLTNIEGGLGVFSAFNYETVYIKIVQMEGSGGAIEI